MGLKLDKSLFKATYKMFNQDVMNNFLLVCVTDIWLMKHMTLILVCDEAFKICLTWFIAPSQLRCASSTWFSSRRAYMLKITKKCFFSSETCLNIFKNPLWFSIVMLLLDSCCASDNALLDIESGLVWMFQWTVCMQPSKGGRLDYIESSAVMLNNVVSYCIQ